MRLVHLSDLHLGFRQFQRTTSTGINQREADVAASFTRAVDRVIALQPEIVVVAGDVFHNVRPTNSSILHAYTEFARIVKGIPGVIVIVVAGNHEMPRSSDTQCILQLIATLGVHVADRVPVRFHFRDRGLSVLAVPDIPPDTYTVEPDPRARLNVLLLHGETEGVLPAFAGREAKTVPLAALQNPAWQYVALGHIHTYTKVADRAFYAGAIDYTSSNPWGEIAQQRAQSLPGKGIIEADLESGKRTFHILPVARRFIDMVPIDGAGLSPRELDLAIAASMNVLGGIDGAVVRLVARNVPLHVVRELDHATLREHRRRALQFHLDTRRPAQRSSLIADTAAGKIRPSLSELLRESLMNRQLDSSVDRTRLVELGAEYLAEAEKQ